MSRVRSKREGRKYAAIPNDAMRDVSLSIEARGMLALMMGYSDDWTFRRSHLMEIAGMGRDKFQRIMGELSGCGYVSLESVRGENGSMIGTTYVIHDDPHASTEGLKTRLSAEGLKTRPSGNPTVGKPGPIRKPDSQALLKEKENQPCDMFSQQDEDAEKKENPSEGFETFWSEYPKRKGANPKAAAKKAWLRAIRKLPPEKLVEGVKRFASSRQGEDPRFTPMASTWLNQERWEDVDIEQTQKMNPDNPMEGIPEEDAKIIRFEIDYEQRMADARAWWARREAAE